MTSRGGPRNHFFLAQYTHIGRTSTAQPESKLEGNVGSDQPIFHPHWNFPIVILGLGTSPQSQAALFLAGKCSFTCAQTCLQAHILPLTCKTSLTLSTQLNKGNLLHLRESLTDRKGATVPDTLLGSLLGWECPFLSFHP